MKAAIAVLVASQTIGGICTAASMSLTASITGTYDVNAPNAQLSAGFLWDGQPHIYGVGVFAQVFNVQPGQSFGAAAFDANIGSVLSRVTTTNSNIAANYRANNPAMSNVFDENGNAIAKYFSGGDNADLGTPTDLLGITIDVDSGTLGKTFDGNHTSTPDPRQSIGIGAPFLLGSVFVRWDGTQNTEMTFANATYSIAGGAIGPPTSGTTIAPVQFVVPEPAAAALFAAGGLWLFAGRKHYRHR